MLSKKKEGHQYQASQAKPDGGKGKGSDKIHADPLGHKGKSPNGCSKEQDGIRFQLSGGGHRCYFIS